MKMQYPLILLLLIPLAVAVDSPQRILSIDSIKPDSMTPGESTTMTITIANEDSKDASNVIVSWLDLTNTILPVGTGNTKSVGTVKADSSEDVEFQINAANNAEPGLYSIAISLTYDINGTPVVQEASAGIKIGGDTKFELVLSDIEYQKVTLSLSNIGKNPAESVTIQIPKQSGYEPIGTAAMALGKLAKNDYVLIPFSLKVKDGSKDLDVVISYTDTDGSRKTSEESIQFESYQISVLKGDNLPKSSNWGTIIAVVVVLALIVSGILFYRRRKKRARDESN